LKENQKKRSAALIERGAKKKNEKKVVVPQQKSVREFASQIRTITPTRDKNVG